MQGGVVPRIINQFLDLEPKGNLALNVTHYNSPLLMQLNRGK